MKVLSRLLFLAFGVLLNLQSVEGQNTCGSPFVIPSLPFNSGAQTTCGTVNDYAAGFAPCVNTNYGGGEDYVYQFTISNAPVAYKFTMGGAATWKILALHSACPPSSANCLAGVASSAGAGNFTYNFTANGTYYLIVDTWPSPACGVFTVDIAPPPPPPSNDDCVGATSLIPNPTCTPVSGTNTNATQSIAPITCASFTSSSALDVWYSFTATAANHTVTVVGGTGFDAIIDVRSGACNGTNIGCADATTVGGTETVNLAGLTIGQTYLVRVYGWAGAQGTFTICVVGQEPAPPVSLNCPTNTTVASCQTQAAINTAFATWLSTANGSGGCNGVLTNDNTGAPSACGGTTTVTFTYTSTCAPFTTTCQASFTVASPPTVVLTCPVNTTVASCQTQAAVNAQFAAWLATASGSGGCSGVLTNDNTGAPSACGGSTTVTFTYTSTCAPITTTCQASFTVAAPPTVVLTCPVNTTVASCQTQAAVNAQFAAWLATASGSGGCSGVLTNDNTGAPSACGGSTTVTFTYTSTCAPLTTTCQASFTVAAPPTVVLTCPNNLSIPANGDQTATNATFSAWLATASASGGCNGVLTNNNTGAPDAISGGSTTVTFTYTSTCAPLTTTCQATFTVTTGPVVTLNCPTNTTAAACQTQSSVNAQFAAWLATANASGGCNGVLTNNNTGAPAACGGSTTVTFTYTSTCAPLTTTCQATFTVAAAPTVVLTCPINTTVTSCQTQAAVNTAFATWLATATATGGCNGVLTNNNTGAPAACGGSTTVTFTYTSTCAPLTTTCQATFTVAAAPTVVLTCPFNTSAATCQTQAAVNAQFASWLASASVSGGCNGVLTNNSTGAPAACGGTTTVTFTYTSSCAPFTTTCQAVFTVPAAPTPVLNCPIPTTASACLTQAQLDAAYAAWLASATTSGGCNGVLTNDGGNAPSICSATAVTKTVTYTYTSTCAPFTTTCTSTFTVSAYPTFTLPANGASTVACPANATQPTPPTVVDGCSKTLTPTGPTIVNNPSPIACEGTRTYSWVYTDCAGHANTWSFVYTIERNPFTVPANGASTVACPSAIVQPVPPTVLSNCGEVLTPTGPVIVNNPNPITCEGTRTYTWTYTDCEGNSLPWSHVTTVERQPFGVPASGGSTVSCPAMTDVQPVPPIVTSNCGEALTPVITSTAKPGCEGNRNWNFTYTDCEGNTATWVYIYTVEYLDFTVPANEVLTVECPLNAVEPTPPTVHDNCGQPVNMNGPVVTSTNNANGCEATRTYAWTFKDCEGNAHTWSRKYNFQYTADFFIYPDGEDFVGCLLYAQPPVPPTVYDNCNLEVAITGPVVTESISGCSGWRKFAYTYKDCGGHSKNWSFTYFANDNEPPVGNCTSGTIASVDVTNLSCLGDVPCPDDYNFSAKAAELIIAGGFYDLCSGTDLVVELDSWTALWECSDPNGDGVNTFGRTFYFRIADQCGNEYPSLCGVTYSGLCSPIETFPQGAWGNAGDEPGIDVGANTTDIQVITALLANNPLVVGGGNRSLTFTDANCLVALVPGLGNPTVLANCQQLNCSGCNPAGPMGMKNILASNTAALMLNMRYNVNYNGIPMSTVRSQDLGCIVISPDIKVCSENGGCKLRVFESNGTAHDFPYNIGGLVDLSNLFLGGNLQLSPAFSLVYASALNTSINNVNNYFHGDMSQNSGCSPSPGIAPGLADDVAKPLPTGNASSVQVAIQLAPNPTSGEVVLKLTEMVETQEVTMTVFNSLGQEVFRHNFGTVTFVNERMDLRELGNGLYFVNLRVGNERFERRLVIAKD